MTKDIMSVRSEFSDSAGDRFQLKSPRHSWFGVLRDDCLFQCRARSRGVLVNQALLFVLLSASALAADAPHASLDEKHRAFFKDYCNECHNEKKQKGKLRLDDISFTLDSVEKADRWQKILNQINSGEMPPEDSKQPERVAKTEFLDSLSHTLMAARRSLGDSGGKITMRRLNRREYKNTLRDLLGVDINVRELPADGGAGTFDTVGSSLFMSSDQFEQYLALGRQALDENFVRYAPAQAARKMHVEAEDRNARIAKSLQDRTDAHERYVKWAAAVDAAAAKPENTAIAATIRNEKKGNATHLYFEWQRLAGAPSPADFKFTDAVNADEQGRRDWVHCVPYQRSYLENPATKTGSFLTIEDVFVNPYQPFRLPGDWPAGDYVVRVRIAATSNTPASRHFVEFGPQHDTGVRAVASSHQVTGTMEQPQILEIPLKFSPAKGYGFFFQEKGTYESEEVSHRLFAEGQKANGIGPEFALWIDWIEVESATDAKLATKPQSFKARTEAEEIGNKRMDGLYKHTKEQHENHAHWAAAVDAAAARPDNMKIAAELREKAKRPRPATGIPYASPLFFYLDWEQIKGAPSPTGYGFKDAQAAFVEENLYVNYFSYYQDYQKLPARDNGAWLMFYLAYRETYVEADKKWPAGKYTLRMRVAANEAAPSERRFIEVGQRGDDVSVFTVLGAHQVTGTLAQPQIIETTVEVTTDGKREFAVRERRPNSRTAEVRSYHDEFEKTGHGPVPAIWIDWLEIAGPVVAPQTHTPVAATPAKSLKLRKDPETVVNPMVASVADDLRNKYEKAKQWRSAVDAAAAKPENAEAVKKAREDPKLKYAPDAFYLHAAEIKGAPPATDFGFADPGNAVSASTSYAYYYQYHADYQKLPNRDTGAYLMLASTARYAELVVPRDWPSGRYVLRARIAATDESPKERRYIEVGFGKGNSADFDVLSSHQITGTLAQPQVLAIPVEITAAGKRNFAIRDKRPNTGEAEQQMWREAWDKTRTGPRPCIWVDFVEIEGPVVATTPALASKTIKERREVELHANAMVGGTYNGYYKGGYEAAKKFIETGMPQKGIPDKEEAKFRVKVFGEHGPSFERYLNDPLTKTGAYLTIFNVHPEEVITLPPDQPSGWMKTKHDVKQAAPGEYMLRFRVGAVKGTPKERHFIALGTRLEKDDFSLIQTFQITGTTDAPQVIEVPVSVSANSPRTFVLREKRDVKLDNELYTAAQKATGVGPPSALWIDWVEWEGPLNKEESTALKPVLFANTTGVSERDHARSIVESFAKRAFRDRSPNPAYVDKLVKLFDARVKAGDKFETAIKEPLSVVLASPRFLYLQETGGSQTIGQSDNQTWRKDTSPMAKVSLSPTELATRLSYFLWSAPPDDTLLSLARGGELTQPAVLALQVDRMIESEKSQELVSGFVSQWLGMERLDFFQFDTKLFRDFDESTKAAARREVYETFSHLLRDNGSLRQLLKSDYVVINGLLGTYYGLEGVTGDEFRKVSLPKDSPRGGLLGMAAVLAMGSNGERSSPVERGAWVLRKLLHDAPPPAPPNVPQITRLEGKLLTTRERLLAHQEQPQCASCHRKIDPIGFGLENFNAVGKWRDEDSYEKKGVGKKTWPIDSAAAFHNGPAFKDYFELRDLIAAKPEAFSRSLTEALIEYALGRPYGFADEELATTIVEQAKSKNFAIREFIIGLVTSREFGRK